MLKRLFILLSFISLVSCTKSNDFLPDIAVDKWLYINNPSNINLQSPGGWIYTTGGIKGLIIYRYSQTEFHAYERSCPHISPSDCSVAEVKQDIFVECPCDGAKFLLISGEPSTISPYPLKQYRVSYNQYDESLHITN